ncbi:MAG: hypothetical protein AAFR42_14805 [Cyanobacteria bacterium J06628_6]
MLLLEKIPLAGIARVTGVSDSWLQDYLNDAYVEVAKTATVVPKAKGNKQWVWPAMDADT